MNNFDFCTPTHVYFGKGVIVKVRELIPSGSRVLMTYGGGSIKRNGVYDQVKKALEGFQVLEFGGIEPNPRYATCLKAVEICRREKVDFLLAVGGGSVLDATKFIAASVFHEHENHWRMITGEDEVKKALPLGDIITLPATGSEMNGNAVISHEQLKEKRALKSPLVKPVFSLIDPSTTVTLPLRQTLNGIVDTFVHVMEQYATYDVNTPVQDLSALAIIRTLLQEGPKVLENPADYDARANLFWCATLGLNTWIAQGVAQDWSTHMIGHELTALYGIDHAQSLAVVLPKLWRYKFEDKMGKLAKAGREVWKCSSEDDRTAAEAALAGTVAFFKKIGMKTELEEYGIDRKEAAAEVSRRLTARHAVGGEHGDIDGAAAERILNGFSESGSLEK